MSNLPSDYQNFIALSKYARYLPIEQRRETFEETVDRYVDYFWDATDTENTGALLDEATEIREAILNLEVMPSMRSLMTAGAALERDNVAGFNCSYLVMNRQRAFDEVLYILMCGTGVGFSCERDEVKNLPLVSEGMFPTDSTIVVSDSKIGWASAFRELISLLYSGKVPKWDLSRVRKAGEPLKTFGGRSSGPEPLDSLFRYSVNLFSSACGRKLSSLEVHGLVCKIAEIVVVGGVRRSALISLSSFSDDRLRHAKSGSWWVDHPEYRLANNSVAYTEKPDVVSFMREWLALVESKSGERGIFNREAARKSAGLSGRRDTSFSFGTNPCSEIILRDRQFCNLSEVVVRENDTFDDLKRKVRLSTIIGTLQAGQTNFRYLSKAWKDNTEEEALLGVSLTGIMDHPVLSGSEGFIGSWFGEEVMTIDQDGYPIYDLGEILEALKEVAVETNKEFAEKLGINQATAITCVKPSGTVSQLVNSASGIHTRHSDYYIRTVRADKKDPLAEMMVAEGFPVEEDVMNPKDTWVFSFPVKSPDGAVTRDDRTAIQQLEHWLIFQRHWCEHKPSVTINVKDDEWMEVGSWVWEHFDEVSGVSFLPHSNHTYQQAPYQECSKEDYESLLSRMPKDVDWGLVGLYENGDMTTGSQELACSGGACDIVDLT